jgi:hypothetical protein
MKGHDSETCFSHENSKDLIIFNEIYPVPADAFI